MMVEKIRTTGSRLHPDASPSAHVHLAHLAHELHLRDDCLRPGFDSEMIVSSDTHHLQRSCVSIAPRLMFPLLNINPQRLAQVFPFLLGSCCYFQHVITHTIHTSNAISLSSSVFLHLV